MKTIRIISSIALVAMAVISFGQIRETGSLLTMNNPQAVQYYSNPGRHQSQLEPWMYDLSSWDVRQVSGGGHGRISGSQPAILIEDEVAIETEPALETWMEAPFLQSILEGEISLESWMTAPFDVDPEIGIEPWMSATWM